MYMDLVIIECQLLFQILLRYKLCIVTSSNTYIFFKIKCLKMRVRQWRCLLLDTDMDKEWSTKTMEEFYGHLVTIDCYKELGLFVMNVLALPQSTAGVERTFSKVTLNKTKLRNSLHISTLESILVTSENFKENFESDNKLKTLHGQARNKYFSKYLESDSNNIEFD